MGLRISGRAGGRGRALGVAVLLAALAMLLAGSVASADVQDHNDVRVVLRGVNGEFVGTATLIPLRSGDVQVSVRAQGLAAGFHGFHVHAVGICDPRATDPNGNVVPFASAGGHFNPGAVGHAGHAGDLPSLLAKRNGVAASAELTDRFRLGDLFDADGSAIIVHAGPDNFGNIPSRYVSSDTGTPGPDAATLATGDSGGRVACGVVRR